MLLDVKALVIFIQELAVSPRKLVDALVRVSDERHARAGTDKQFQYCLVHRSYILSLINHNIWVPASDGGKQFWPFFKRAVCPVPSQIMRVRTSPTQLRDKVARRGSVHGFYSAVVGVK